MTVKKVMINSLCFLGVCKMIMFFVHLLMVFSPLFLSNYFDLGISKVYKRQKEKGKLKREEQEAQDILKSARFVITEEWEDLVADLFRRRMGLKDQILLL